MQFLRDYSQTNVLVVRASFTLPLRRLWGSPGPKALCADRAFSLSVGEFSSFRLVILGRGGCWEVWSEAPPTLTLHCGLFTGGVPLAGTSAEVRLAAHGPGSQGALRHLAGVGLVGLAGLSWTNCVTHVAVAVLMH